MKKIAATVLCLLALTFTAIPAGAQTRGRRNYDQRIQTTRYSNDVYRDQRYRSNATSSRYGYDNRSVWDKHRDKITTAGGAVAGAVIGGLIGGKKGAILGALAGGGGAALYTYKVRQ